MPAAGASSLAGRGTAHARAHAPRHSLLRGNGPPVVSRGVRPPRAYDRDTLPPPPAPPPAPPPLAGSGPGGRGPVPPPPPGRRTALGAPPSRKTLLATAALSLTAGALWWAALFASDPVQLGVSDDGFAFATTAGGNTVLVSRDDDGRFFFVDRAGDLYYDAGAAGFYIVDPADVVYNGYVDDAGEPHRVVVGKLADIVTFRPEAVAGIPVKALAALAGGGARGGPAAGLFTALDTSARDEADPAAVLLPPNAPVGVDKDGKTLAPPRLEEGMMLLEQQKGVLGGKPRPDPADPLDRLAAVADRAAVLKRAYDDAVEAGVVDPVKGE